jgi:hypothetical protein
MMAGKTRPTTTKKGQNGTTSKTVSKLIETVVQTHNTLATLQSKPIENCSPLVVDYLLHSCLMRQPEAQTVSKPILKRSFETDTSKVSLSGLP